MCESTDHLVTNRFRTDRRFVPAETTVDISLLEPLADVVHRDEVCLRYSHNARRNEFGSDLVAGEFDE